MCKVSCSLLMPECSSHQFCLREEPAVLPLEQRECEHRESFSVKMLRTHFAYFRGPATTLPASWGSCMDLAEGRETGPSLSIALSPYPDVLLLNPEACPGFSSARAEDSESLASAMDFEFPVSEHFSHLRRTRTLLGSLRLRHRHIRLS